MELMKNTPQEYKWHQEGNVWNHTVLALLHLNPNADPLTYSALFFHDIGKCFCSYIDDKGQIRSTGHAKVGADWVRNNIPGTNRDLEIVCWLIENHMSLWNATEEVLIQLRQESIDKFGTDKWMQELVWLCEADNKGTITDIDTSVDFVEMYNELSR